MLFLLWTEFIRALWILFPAFAANCFPTFIRVYGIKGHPIDFGKSYKGNRLFGEGKTIEGFSLGLVAGFLVALAELGLYPYLNAYANQFDVSLSSLTILICFLIPLGALTGDLIKSFFKRRLGIQRGGKLMGFDQLDFVVGTIIFTSLFIDYTLLMVIWMFLFSFVIHRMSSIIGYILKIKREPW
ncbi:MAG: CDP-2,3-bis-(O-geranylgeranyl)-sn-glycerol synthase [Candidatus Aenigmarchaeota archaeon]|nr:CDP-2,3-bis-(O-geranylgeranyl)-sn-glycerol synthase [Candidatus Aenigmarchaeota archaeon]